MKAKSSARLLVAVGVVTMLWARLKEITVETASGMRVVNLHLMSEKETLMILGAVLTIAGAILFAVARLKETPEEEAREEEKRKEASAAVGAAALAAKDALRSVGVASVAELAEPARRVAGFYRDRGGLRGIVVRLVVGITTGFCAFLAAISLGTGRKGALETLAAILALPALIVCTVYPVASTRRRAMPIMLAAVLLVSLVSFAVADGPERVVPAVCAGYVFVLLLLFWLDSRRVRAA